MNSIKRLHTEYNELIEDPDYFYSFHIIDDDINRWGFTLIGPPETFYEGGIFTGTIKFPKNYPLSPPEVKFTNMFHPNIYSRSGTVCISILHSGIDQTDYEKVSERWNPSHSVRSVMTSILSLLGDPNFDSPANVEASNLWRQYLKEKEKGRNSMLYKEIIYKIVAKSQK